MKNDGPPIQNCSYCNEANVRSALQKYDFMIEDKLMKCRLCRKCFKGLCEYSMKDLQDLIRAKVKSENKDLE